MPVRTKAIVLNTIKYGDSSLIAKMLTEQSGLQTFMLRGILKSRKGKLKPAFFQPLTQLEIVATLPPKDKLGYIREAMLSYPYSTVQTDVAKSAIALFLSEMLAQSIREQDPDSQCFQYIETSLQWMDQHDKVANFHIHFLIGLTRYLGFYPDRGHSAAAHFDLAEGSFCHEPSWNPCMSGKELEHFKLFLGTKFEAIHTIKMSQNERRTLLQYLVRYFEIHLHGFKKPRSLAILNEVFS
jgi:DNA repair protein RecO (recombination protein O)